VYAFFIYIYIYIYILQRSGRIEEEIQMLQLKLKRIENGVAFGGRKTKTARSQGKKVQITLEEEISRWMLLLFFSLLSSICYSFLIDLDDFDTLSMQDTRELGLGLHATKQI